MGSGLHTASNVGLRRGRRRRRIMTPRWTNWTKPPASRTTWLGTRPSRKWPQPAHSVPRTDNYQATSSPPTGRKAAGTNAGYCELLLSHIESERAREGTRGVRFAATRVVRGRLVTPVVASSDKPLPNPPRARVLLVVLFRRWPAWQWIHHHHLLAARRTDGRSQLALRRLHPAAMRGRQARTGSGASSLANA